MPMFEGRPQDNLMALVKCGVLAEEVRKVIFQDRDHFLQTPVRYSLIGKRFGVLNGNEVPMPDANLYQNLNVAFLGGGALGCWGAIAGSSLGFGRLDVYDYDVFESHNINRQVLGFDGIGKAKAPHIADKIKSMSLAKQNLME